MSDGRRSTHAGLLREPGRDDRVVSVGLALFATAISGVVVLILLGAVGPLAGVLAGVAVAVLLVALRPAVPLSARHRRH